MRAGQAPLPEVSVLLPVRDAVAFLPESVGSIRRQTLTAWELVAVDDGSSDGSGEWLRRAATEDQRIRVIAQEGRGLVAALNCAAAEAHGVFLARMDADDVARPMRLARQVEFLKTHPAVGVVGSAVRRIGAASGIWRRPGDDAALRAELLFRTPFVHPTVMLRRELWETAAEGGYREDFRAAEDIDLWERLAPHTAFGNLDEPLLDYRVHAAQVTRVATAEMVRNCTRVLLRWLRRSGVEPSVDEATRHEALAWLRAGDAFAMENCAGWLARLDQANATSLFFEPEALKFALGRQWFEFARAHSRLGWAAWRIYRGSQFSDAGGVPGRARLRFALLCVLRNRHRVSPGRTEGEQRVWPKAGS
ncbi:MAG TPA: glycosyltransferase [Opitutus sp.]|nr:glycosyltransferase [Opitutus sp.]